MKTSIRVITAVAICLAAQSSFAQQTMFGRPDCGEWLNDSPSEQGMNKAWLLGFLSGLSASQVIRGDPLNALSSAAQAYVWMDNFCRKNPLDTVAYGAYALFFELADRSKTRK